MVKSTGKVREKSGNFVSPKKWEPCPSFLDPPIEYHVSAKSTTLEFCYLINRILV